MMKSKTFKSKVIQVTELKVIEVQDLVRNFCDSDIVTSFNCGLILGPPYDSNENEEYQRDNERFRYNNNNNNRNPIDTSRDNVRFPVNNDDYTSRNQVRN